MLLNGCFHIGPVTGPRSAILWSAKGMIMDHVGDIAFLIWVSRVDMGYDKKLAI